MPLIQYRCINCGFEFQELQTAQDHPLTDCSHCHYATLRKSVSSFNTPLLLQAEFNEALRDFSHHMKVPKTAKHFSEEHHHTDPYGQTPPCCAVNAEKLRA